MKGSIFLFLICLVGFQLKAEDKTIGILYLNTMFGHVHIQAEQFASSLTTMACGHPVKVLNPPSTHHDSKWLYVRVGEVKGYVAQEFLSEKRPDCFQDNYPKYFNALNLDLNELYYWGRLYDHFVNGESKVK